MIVRYLVLGGRLIVGERMFEVYLLRAIVGAELDNKGVIAWGKIRQKVYGSCFRTNELDGGNGYALIIFWIS